MVPLRSRGSSHRSIAVRGTDLEKSYGGDLFTDANALPERAVGADGTIVTAHGGMLASAKALVPELRQAVLALVRRGYQVIFLGHSLGAGVVALLAWLFRHGAENGDVLGPCEAQQIFGIGYATPSVVDGETATSMRPYFTSLANSVDVVPRLGLESVQRLANDIKKCANEAATDGHLDADMEAYLDRVSSVWAPRLRTEARTAGEGDDEATTPATAAVPGDPDASKDMQGMLRRFSRRAAAAIQPASGREGPRAASLAAVCEDVEASSPSQLPSESTKLLEFAEGSTLVVPSAESVLLAWYGDAREPWSAKKGFGVECTEELHAKLEGGKLALTITNQTFSFGDPCEGKRKKFLVLLRVGQRVDLFVPGVVVWMYRRNGSLECASVPYDSPSLRRIICDKRMLVDHGRISYHRALLTVRARRQAVRTVRWQSFADADDVCPCCHNRYDWMSTSRSSKQRWASMTNCRACGLVVCVNCASQRQALQDLGILDPARICDSCAWRGPGGAAVLPTLSKVFAAAQTA